MSVVNYLRIVPARAGMMIMYKKFTCARGII